MESKKINQLATNVAPQSTDLTIIGDPITGVSKKITWLQVSTLIGTAANLQQVTDNGAVTTNPIAIGGLTITGLATGVLKSNSGVIASVPFGAANGVATLGGDGKVPSIQLPSYVDDVVEVANYAALPAIGETGKIYITLDTNKVYRWTGSIYVEIAANNAVWGAITGTLSNQTDLQNALNAKLSSVGLSMPSGFSVANSPLTSNGTIAVTGAGNSTQYLDGTGALQTFPTLLSSDNLVKLVRNQSGATMTAGTVIYISGATGNKPLIAKALATGDATSAQTYGIVQANIANNADGYIVIIGNVGDLDTSALTEGQQLYLSATTSGAYTTTKQYAPNHLVYVGIVLRSHPTQGIIGVKIQNGYEMDELHNVAAQSASNGDILQYVSSTSLWTKTAGTTTNIAEGTNLYFTDTRARNAISLTTTGTSGAATYTSGVLNIPNYGSALSDYVTLGTTQTISGAKTFSTFTQFNSSIYANAEIRLVNAGTSSVSFLQNISVIGYVSTGANMLGFNTNKDLYISSDGKGYSVIAFNNGGTGYTYTLPALNGTIALTSQLTSGTVTSVGLSSATSGVTIGSSPITSNGTITLAIATASGSQNGLLSSTDWTTFNSKQNALTNPITGTGTTNYIPKFTASGTIGNSSITDASSLVTITSDLRVRNASGSGAVMQIYSDGADDVTFQAISATTGGNKNLLYYGADVLWITGTLNVNGGSEKMRITQTGNVGIGTSTTNAKLDVKTSGNGLSFSSSFISSDSSVYGNALLISHSDGITRLMPTYLGSGIDCNLTFWTTTSAGSQSERMRITSGGNVGIGTSSPTHNLEIKNASGSVYQKMNADFGIGYFGMETADDSMRFVTAQATPIQFYTDNTERMRITSGGNVLISQTTDNNDGKLEITTTGGNAIKVRQTSPGGYGLEILAANNASTYYFQNFTAGATGTGGSITSNGVLVSFNTTSDYRLKQDFKDYIGLDLVSRIKTYDYEWKSNKSRMYGMVAHELQEVIPYAVLGEKDGEQMQQVDYSKIVPILVKAIQEQQAQIEELKAKIK